MALRSPETVRIFITDAWWVCDSGGGAFRMGRRTRRVSIKRRREVEFLVFVVLASAGGIALVLMRNRRPTSIDHSISEFERGLQALAPDASSRGEGSDD